VQYGRGERI